jgi:hypothetical protein
VDLDELIHTELAAQADRAPDAAAVLAGVPARARARRRTRLALGGAAAAAVLAAGIPYAALRGDPAAPAPPPPPSAAERIGLPERVVVDRCRSVVAPAYASYPPPPGAPSPSAPPRLEGGRVLAVHRDERGYLVWVAGPGFDWHCAFRPDSALDADETRDRNPGGPIFSRPRDYLPAGTGAQLEVQSDGGALTKNRAGQWLISVAASGLVSPGVRRVLVRWTGAPPVAATVEGPYWVVRVTIVLPRVSGPGPNPRVDAYDGAGRLVKRG